MIAAGPQSFIHHSPPCGSGLARESVRSANINADCANPFVSKPTPTLDLASPESFIYHSPSGSELARESVRSANINADCTDPFVSKLTPTLDRGQP